MNTRKWLTLCCLLILCLCPAQPAAAQVTNDWQMLPASGEGGAYIDSRYIIMDGTLTNIDGVLYVPMGIFGLMLGISPDIDWANGIVRYQQYDYDGQSSETLLMILARDKQVEITATDHAATWQHRPFWQESSAEGAWPNLMLPLREACQTLDIAVDYRDGMVFVGQRHQPMTLPDSATIQALKANINIPVRCLLTNDFQLNNNNGRVTVDTYRHPVLWQSPSQQEGALVLAYTPDHALPLIVQEVKNDGTRQTRYTLPGFGSLGQNYGNTPEHIGRASALCQNRLLRPESARLLLSHSARRYFAHPGQWQPH